jgi:hypothetical protein
MAPRVSVKVTGLTKVIKNIQSAGKRWEDAVSVGLYREGTHIMTESKLIVPLDLGPLRASGYVTLPVVQNKKITVELGYGGTISNTYAEKQHENTFYHHAPGRQAHYLSDIRDAHENQLATNVATVAVKAFESHEKPTRTTMPIDPNEGEQMYAAKMIGSLLRGIGRDIAKQAKGGGGP